MATQVLPAAFLRDTDIPASSALSSPLQPSLLRRMFDAFTQAQMRRAQREIARVMASKGLRFEPKR